ncbi:hypothetical protein [Methylocystis heyeri]|uniref:Uncharacterized protein n=1 Tax=Methylocystis heyeri TaxID=391905 RepID=A0A6B8KCK9_9HYPH|nr:hypothetical protein [Methylocystis heyeri]QGM46164.1 hypothetical protein H2LOC_010910 [Methylocystis heyeri]
MNEDVGTFFAPITLMIGGALIAGGLLSFLDINFFRTKLQARLALIAGLVFMLATEALFLTSSTGGRYLAGQRIDITDCEFKVERTYPVERSTNKALISEKIKECMEGIGYEWILDHPHCQEAKLATNTFCYLPRGPFDRTIVGFQMKFE